MRRGSGPLTTSPSMRTSPRVGAMKPAMMFRMVDLPQPDGPSRHTNSPSRTDRLMSSRTLMLPPSRSNTMPRPSTRSLSLGAVAGAAIPAERLVIRVPPADRWHSFQRSDTDVEQQPDDADHDHPGDDQIVAVAGVARVDDHEAEARVDRDHLGGDDDHPRNPERDSQANHQLRHDCRI